ncbi:MAG TPA: peptidylprolyl isomerase, partial [Cyclobacteriaceae bacterium]|nr:peptidylprolyl isomerase [Cyclobacteriaceae bacterium]
MPKHIFLLACLVLAACADIKGPNKFSDPVIVEIYNLKDRRSADSLRPYLTSENPVYRREAALAFASVQDSTAGTLLGNILKEDSDLKARLNAAFALGQCGGHEAVNALIPSIYHSEDSVVREVLEALGKTVQQNDLNDLREFRSGNTLDQVGHAAGMLQLALRRKADSLITVKITEYLLPTKPADARLAAGFYFARSARVHGKGFINNLIKSGLHDSLTLVRMAAVGGFKHLPVEKAVPALDSVLKFESDYRARVNAMRACQSFSLSNVGEIVFGGLSDTNEMVRVAASEVLLNLSGDIAADKRIGELVKDEKNLRVKANLYGSLLKTHPPEGTLQQMINEYATADTYYKAGLLGAMSYASDKNEQPAFDFLSSELLNPGNAKVILTSSASAIVALNKSLKNKIPNKEFLNVYEKAVALKDAGVTGIVSGAFSDEKLNYRADVIDLKFLYDAKAGLTLPKDIESLQPLENAIAFLEGKQKPKALKAPYNHPINWKLVKTIPPDQKVEIKTTKGVIIIQLLVEEAPGSVGNFVELVEKKYYDGKNFHRVVPNFVIQGGCSRGDGYGSEDYSIRSEFSRTRYTTGSVGMASAGKDTEGTQWFITQSPTPHLDGKYTIIAQT